MVSSYKWLSFLFLFLSLILSGCTENNEKSGTEIDSVKQTVWRFALEEVEGSVQDAYAKEFKRRIESGSNNQIKVEVYPYGALGTSSQLTELVQSGALELAFASPGHLASVIPEVGIFTLHFVLSDDNAINKEVLSSQKVHSHLQGPYNRQGLQLLSIVPEGWMVWTADKPLTSPADFEGFVSANKPAPFTRAMQAPN